MITLQRIHTKDTQEYQFMEELIVASFPTEEYRELEELRHFTDEKQAFHNNVILDNGKPIGLFTYWDFGTFYYVEHFAVDSNLRNGGYGKKTLEAICNTLKQPIVLEVEHPDTEMAQRRINFYQRHGFKLWENDYLQPPYRKGDEYLPLHLMAYGEINPDEIFEHVKEKIYNEVYQVEA